MNQCKTQIAAFASKVVEKWVADKERLVCDNIPQYMQTKSACFVSLHTADGNLRGCIGTIEPRHQNLALEIVENAIAACNHDPRFSPVSEQELNNLVITVDVLSTPEKTIIENLDPLKYGIIVTDGYRKGVLLPALENIVDTTQQINIAKRKAGLLNVDNNLLDFFRFTSTRFD